MKSLSAFAFAYRGVLVALCPMSCLMPAWGALDPRAWTAVAALLLCFGTALRLAGIREIGGRARVHSAGARDLVTSGIFASMRNPLYLGNTLAAAGAIGLLAGPLAAVTAALYLGLVYSLVVRHEERVLLALWGAPYRTYVDQVPRWFPMFAKVRTEERMRERFSWSEVLRLERWGVAAVVCALSLQLLIPGTVDLLMQRSEPRAILAALSALVFVVLFVRRASRSLRKHGLLYLAE